MKRYVVSAFFVAGILCMIVPTYSADPKSEGTPYSYSQTDPQRRGDIFGTIADGLSQGGLHKNRIMVWGGTHKHLYGYTDKRYKTQANASAEDKKQDQGDYISVNAENGGMEFYMSDFSDISSMLTDGKFGMNISYYHHDRIPQRSLYEVLSHGIASETVPPSEAKMLERWWVNTGFFLGVDKKWFEIDVGLTLKTTIIKEKYREKLDPASTPSNPIYVRTKGRGAIFEDEAITGNFFFRFGLENRPHFIFSYYRDDYDPVYGVSQIKLCFPINNYFQFNTGGYVRKTQSMFVEPIIKVAGIECGIKTGLILNYGNDAKMKTGIKDSVYGSIKMAYAW